MLPSISVAPAVNFPVRVKAAILVAVNVSVAKVKSASSINNPLVDAKGILPEVKLSAVSDNARKSYPPISTLFATVKEVSASAVPPFISGVDSQYGKKRSWPACLKGTVIKLLQINYISA